MSTVSLNRRSCVPKTATVDIGVDDDLSSAICLDGFAIGMVYVPSTFDGTAITFSVCDTIDGTYQPYEGADGNAVSVTTNASSAFALPEGLFGAPYCKLVMGSAQTTTNTVFTLTMRG